MLIVGAVALAGGVGSTVGLFDALQRRVDDAAFTALAGPADNGNTEPINAYIQAGGRHSDEARTALLPLAEIRDCANRDDVPCLAQHARDLKNTELGGRAAQVLREGLESLAARRAQESDARRLCSGLVVYEHGEPPARYASLLSDCKRRYTAAFKAMSDGPVRRYLVPRLKAEFPVFIDAADVEPRGSRLEQHPMQDLAAYSLLADIGYRMEGCALLDDIARGRTVREMKEKLPTFVANAKSCVENQLPAYMDVLAKDEISPGVCASSLLVDLFQRWQWIRQGAKPGKYCVGAVMELTKLDTTAPVSPATALALEEWVGIEFIISPTSNPPALVCFDDVLRGDPAWKGEIVLRLEGSPTGGVSSAKAQSHSLSDPVVVDCVVKASLDWKLPPLSRQHFLTFHMSFKGATTITLDGRASAVP